MLKCTGDQRLLKKGTLPETENTMLSALSHESAV